MPVIVNEAGHVMRKTAVVFAVEVVIFYPVSLHIITQVIPGGLIIFRKRHKRTIRLGKCSCNKPDVIFIAQTDYFIKIGDIIFLYLVLFKKDRIPAGKVLFRNRITLDKSIRMIDHIRCAELIRTVIAAQFHPHIGWNPRKHTLQRILIGWKQQCPEIAFRHNCSQIAEFCR